MAARQWVLLVTVSLAGALPAIGHADDWEDFATRDGIVASRRFVEGRELPQLRSIAEVAGTPYEILAVLLDFPAYRKWVPDCAEATTLRRLDAWRSIIHTRTDLPWPVLDREAVIEQEVTFVRAPELVKVYFRAIDAPDVARAPDTVRTSDADGSYTIQALDDGRSRVTYMVYADPGGTLPDWLIKMQSTRNPLGTLASLRDRLEATRGQYREQIAGYPSGN
jgi:hypothetical protein